MHEVIEQLRQSLPPLFLGSAIDELTGRAIRWRTTQNRRCRDEIPADCFVRSGPRVLVIRDKFLDWWGATLRPARETNTRTPRPRRGDRLAAERNTPSQVTVIAREDRTVASAHRRSPSAAKKPEAPRTRTINQS